MSLSKTPMKRKASTSQSAVCASENLAKDSKVNKYLHHPEQGLALFAQLIANNSNNTLAETQVNQTLAQIKQLIEHDFLVLAKSDNNALSASTYVELQQLQQQLGELVAFPHLEKYYTIAVGGSFSAGKSRFFELSTRLPVFITDRHYTYHLNSYLYFTG